MAAVNVRNGLLYFDFRYKGKRCREYTKLSDTPAHRKRMEKICERIEAEITLGTFVYRNYFPESSRAKVFDELEVKQERLLAGTQPSEPVELLPLFAEFTETWLMEKRIEWRDSHYLAVVGVLNAYALPAFGEKKARRHHQSRSAAISCNSRQRSATKKHTPEGVINQQSDDPTQDDYE